MSSVTVTGAPGLRLWAQPRREYGRHLRLLFLNEAAEAKGEAEVWEHGGVVEGRVQRLELDCVGRLRLGLLLTAAKKLEKKSFRMKLFNEISLLTRC